jgi:hypothetical protein
VSQRTCDDLLASYKAKEAAASKLRSLYFVIEPFSSERGLREPERGLDDEGIRLLTQARREAEEAWSALVECLQGRAD